MKTSYWAAVASITVTLASTATAQPQHDMGTTMTAGSSTATMDSVNKADVDKIIATWPERPRLGATEMMVKYGMPQEVTSERVIWHNPGPFKKIAVTRQEDPHDFPLPHMDFMEHTIAYKVPADKVADLIAFDGSSTIDKTVGELTARCDLEGHNILTFNLDHDIITGKKTVEEAREAFGKIVVQDVKGEHPPYVEKLQFDPVELSDAANPDKSVIPGSPVRAAEAKDMSGDKAVEAEILATVLAVDMGEILAASQAKMKKISEPVLEYAKMIHTEHGMHMEKTMMLGKKMDVTPTITDSVDKLQQKGAGELAKLVPLDGKEFEQAYVAAMIKGHTEVLAMIDDKLLTATENDTLKDHLTKTRAAIAGHLEKAKALQSGM